MTPTRRPVAESRSTLRARPRTPGPVTLRRRLLLVALTGTPGTGKTSAGRALRALGFPVLALNRLAKRFALGYDRPRRTWVVDERRLARHVAIRLPELYVRAAEAVPRRRRREGVLVVEGHFAHDLAGLDLLVVLRADPRIVERRLRRRGYSRAKARENAEAEAIGVVAAECRDVKDAFELDVTRLPPRRVAEAVAALIRDPARGRRIGHVDWADAIAAW